MLLKGSTYKILNKLIKNKNTYETELLTIKAQKYLTNH